MGGTGRGDDEVTRRVLEMADLDRREPLTVAGVRVIRSLWGMRRLWILPCAAGRLKMGKMKKCRIKMNHIELRRDPGFEDHARLEKNLRYLLRPFACELIDNGHRPLIAWKEIDVYYRELFAPPPPICGERYEDLVLGIPSGLLTVVDPQGNSILELPYDLRREVNAGPEIDTELELRGMIEFLKLRGRGVLRSEDLIKAIEERMVRVAEKNRPR